MSELILHHFEISPFAEKVRKILRIKGLARAATPRPGKGVAVDDPEGLEPGMLVEVIPDDYGKVPVTGRVVTANAYEVAIARTHDRTGGVVVHFPRIGFRTVPVRS
ncbi:MAG: hypothetical protein D6763_01610 [Alphaproteobacteria bacterium]|nr:MAG: hypothetical protein D6763_01610 [Alphaproteobacteria bacterium]